GEKSTALYRQDNEKHQEQVTLKEKPLDAGIFIDPEVKNDGVGVEKFLQGKVLRTMPGVAKIYLVIRAKDKEVAKQRLKNEIVDMELFKCLKEAYGEHYEAFIWNKLVPVVENVGDSNLGIYDVALEIKAIGLCNHDWNKHSVKRDSRQGRFMEEKVRTRDIMGRETFRSGNSKEFLPTLLKNEIKLASDYKKIFKDNVVAQKMKELGIKS
ncbi:Fatty acyl-coenzyme A reductase, partial [Theobroma cacao]